MIRTLTLLSFVALPSSALASSHARLLEGKTLQLSMGSLLVLAAADAPSAPPLVPAAAAPQESPPPAPAPEATATTTATAEEGPGLGGVLGFMISGGVTAGIGLIWTLYGVAYLAGGFGTVAGATAAGVILLVIGVAHLAVGGLLLFLGNNKRIERNEWNAAHGITDDVRPAEKPSAARLLAVSF